MADLICTADGNFTTASTWKLVDTTSKLISTSASITTLGTGNSDSQTFTPGAIEVDGIALRLASRASGSPTNTLNVILRNSTDGVDVASVAVSVADLPACSTTDNEGGWFFAKFSSPITLTAGKAYLVRCNLSSTSTAVALYRDTTTNNHQRMLRRTTTQAPAAGDDLHIMGEYAGGGGITTRTVTMDSTAATDYGSANVNALIPALTISKGGTLTYGTAAATNYVLRVSGHIVVFSGGTLNIGTTGTPVPRDSTAVLEFDSTAGTISGGAFGLQLKNLSSFVAQGLSRTSGKDVYACLLNTDEAVGQTTLGVDTDTGWLSGDVIAIASTTRSRAEAEQRTLSSNAGASSLDITAGLTYAHSGSAPTQAEVVLLTRNVKIRSVSASNPGYLWVQGTATVDIDWTEFRYMGGAGTVAGVLVSGTGTVSVQYCACRDSFGYWFYMDSSTGNNFTFRYNVGYSTGGASSNIAIRVATTSGTNWTVADVTVVGTAAGSTAFYFEDLGGTISNLQASGVTTGITFTPSDDAAFGTVENLYVHSNAGTGINFNMGSQTLNRRTFTNLVSWRNSGVGVSITGSGPTVPPWREIQFPTLVAFGNTTSNVDMSGYFHRCYGSGWDLAGETGFTTTNGINFSASNRNYDWRFDNASFGVVTGNKIAHTNDINFATSSRYTLEFWNCTFASSTEWLGTSNITAGSAIRSTRHDGTATRHKTTFYEGTVEDEQTIYYTAAPSAKLTPNSNAVSAFRFEGVRVYAPVNSGGTVTFSVRVRKNASYDGSAPRLCVKANPAIGINADTVLDTHTAAADVWEELTGTSPAANADGVVEAVVDCDYGTGGSIYVDDFVVV